MMKRGVYLVVTDLDGSLLDHDDYGYAPAVPVLRLLEELRIPVVFASSKTRAEILDLRREIGNEHPFSVENGAAVFVPVGYFPEQPQQTVERDGYWVRELAPPRASWSAPLAALRERMPGAFTDFATLGEAGIARLTGLPPDKARLANQRDYSEPVHWQGDAQKLDRFLSDLGRHGARVLRGGRFYTVTGDCDKGKALLWLRQQYALAADVAAVYDLAVGDGGNDVPMLELAHRALRIPACGRPLPRLRRTEGVIDVDGTGPEAWARGVREWLRELYEAAQAVRAL